MVAAQARSSVPRPLLTVGVPIAGVVLVAFFVFLGFPYDKLGERIALEIERRSNARVDFQSIGPALQLGGPCVEATGVRATLSDGETLRFDRALLRPAWSLSWLRGQPAFRTEIESASGTARGTLTLGESGGWSGRMEQVDLAGTPLGRILPGSTIAGTVDASVDLARSENGPTGSVTFEAKDGALAFSSLPMPIPFQTLTGDLRFGDDAFVQVKRLDLAGPVLNGGATGSVLQAATFAEAPLRMELQFNADPDLQAALRSAGFRVTRSGASRARVTGTVSQPVFR